MTAEAIVATGIALVILVWGWSAWRARRSVYKVFNVPPAEYRLLGTDLGRRKPLYLRMGALRGAPDGSFISRNRKEGVVGEYKSRDHRGFIRRRERYQCILYMGMMKQRYKLDQVRAVLRFADVCVDVPFDPQLFERLVALGPEFQSARKRWRASNTLPLHKRPIAH